MVYGNVKKEKMEHETLLNLLKKHFGKDESDMESFDEDLGKPMKAKSALRKLMRSRQENAYESDSEDSEEDPDMSDEDDEEEDGQYLDDYDDEGDQDHETEDEDEREIPKEHRKRMSIAVLSKKFSKPKRKDM